MKTTDVPANAFSASTGTPLVIRRDGKSPASELIEHMAEDLNENIGLRPRGLGEDGDMELALLKFNTTMKDNLALRTKVAEMEGRVEAAKTETADARERIKSLQEQRDVYSNYAIEVKTRMETLLVMLEGNASETEQLIATTVKLIETFVDTQLEQLQVQMDSNATTARKLITEALEAAKKETIVRLQNQMK